MSRGFDVRIAKVVVHRLLRDTERAANTDRRQIPVVYEAINSHLRDSHDRSNFRHSQEFDITKGVLRSVGHYVIRSYPCRLPGPVEGNPSRGEFPATVDSKKNLRHADVRRPQAALPLICVIYAPGRHLTGSSVSRPHSVLDGSGEALGVEDADGSRRRPSGGGDCRAQRRWIVGLRGEK